MILLRNLLLAVGAFVVTGVGFYSYLIQRLPPDQMQAGVFVPGEGGAQAGAVIRDQAGATVTRAAAVARPDRVSQQTSASLAASPGPATVTPTAETPSAEAPSSSTALFAAVIEDFIAASRSGAEADVVREQAAFEARYRVPDWLSHRFDQQAERAGKTLTGADKSSLLATLLDLRQMKQDQLGTKDVSTLRASDLSLTSDWSIAARAMQAELQFRGALDMGLADFMKSLSSDELQRLLSLPRDQSALTRHAASAATLSTAAMR